MSKIKPVSVWWKDSVTRQGWQDDDNLPEIAPIHSVGWLLPITDKKEIHITAHYNAHPQQVSHCDIMCIPRCAIESITEIKLPRRK